VRAARAGKHVFCEKPIALDREITLQALEAIEETGMVFQVGFHRRFDPDWALAAERIRDDELGEPYLFRSSLRDMVSPPVSFLAGSGGLFVDVTIHDLDVARWMVGEVTEVCAHGAVLSDPAFADGGDVDTAVVTLRFENGALGVLDSSRSAGYGYECSAEVMGSRATLRIVNPPLHPVEWRTPGRLSSELVRDFEQRFPLAYTLELEAFARCVLDDLPPRVDGRDALAAFDLASAAALSFRTGKRVSTRAHRVDGGVLYETAPVG
jgi:myo-inositol 2-dehydrogenase/D-chiro-inositol 1-dehydrogenase